MRTSRATTVRSTDPGKALRRQLGQLFLHLVLIVVCFTAVMPFVWMFLGSFKKYVELTSSVSLLPKVWTLNNYKTIVTRVNFLQALQNSAVIASLVTISTVITSAAAGYVFAKYRFWGKERFFSIILSTMMVPFAVIVVPLYVTIANMGLANKLAGIAVTGLFSTFGIFMMRQFMESLPNELIDAGRIDGASEWWIFVRVVLPLSGSPLSALAVFTFLWEWDSYMWPLIVLTSPKTQTLPLVLAGLRSLYWSRYDLWTAGSMLTVAPVMLLYAVAQKQFIRGIAMTGMKA